MLARLTLLLVLAIPGLGSAQTLFKPVAVVNDSAITGFDLAQRAQILVALGFPSASPDALRSEALNRLVEDRLKLQAGRQVGLRPTPDTVERGLAIFAQRGGMQPDEFRVLMSNQGVTDQALEDLAVAEAIWLEVIRARFGSRIEPGEAEIDAELGIFENRTGFDYRILEIGLPLEDGNRTEPQTRALAEQLYESLNSGGDFAEAVRAYSRAPSAARGGEVGWVTTERMPPELIDALAKLEPGQVSSPLAVAGGLSLIKLIEKRESASGLAADPEARAQARERLVNQQAGRLAEGLLQEMRRDALIEVR